MRNAVAPREDVGPKLGDIARTWKPSGHADDCNGPALRVPAQPDCLILHHPERGTQMRGQRLDIRMAKQIYQRNLGRHVAHDDGVRLHQIQRAQSKVKEIRAAIDGVAEEPLEHSRQLCGDVVVYRLGCGRCRGRCIEPRKQGFAVDLAIRCQRKGR
ncbi:hypothetical protein R69746_06095 [Paraburkholderia aspalathi]|nr:hypothetical protein R69746_06095 [Paraburkholderia aspalathi]